MREGMNKQYGYTLTEVLIIILAAGVQLTILGFIGWVIIKVMQHFGII